MSGFSTIDNINQKTIGEISGDELLLLFEPNDTSKISLTDLSSKITELAGTTYNTFFNALIDDVSNFIHANALHFVAVPIQDIPMGAPLRIVPTSEIDVVHVDIATSNDDNIVGICEDGMTNGQQGEVMTHGIIKGYNTSTYSEGELLYYQSGVITNSPDLKLRSQLIGVVLDSNIAGRILVNVNNPINSAMVEYDNSDGNLASSNVQGAIDELAARQVKLSPKITIASNQLILPEAATGGLTGNIARVYDEINPDVFNEYTINLDETKLIVSFDAGDNLNGFDAVVSYLV